MTSKQTPPRVLAAVAGSVLLFGACGEPPVIDYKDRPAPPPAVDFGERPPDVNVLPDGTANLTGQVKNWVSLAIVDGATIKTYGLNPPVEGAADAAGGFTMQVQAAGVFWAYAYKTGYAYTYDFVQMPAGDYNKTLYVVSDADLAAMAAAYGVTQNPACGVVVGEVRNAANQGEPNIENVTLAGVEYQGPYFLNAQGQPQAGRTYTSESGRVVFFNVCDIGTTTVTTGRDAQITVLDPGYGVQPQFLKVFPGGVTRGVVKVNADAPPPPPPPDPVVVDFAAEIYPLFTQHACAACHVEGGAAGGTGLYFDGPPEEVYALLREGNTRVNLNYPEQSYVLTKPLLEDPPNHPNASFTSTAHPDYVKLLGWINQGAPYGVNPPPPIVEPVDFYDDVYGILQNYDAQNYPYGRGCATCHYQGNNQGTNLYLTGGRDVVYQALVDRNLYDLNYPERSKLLRNPYCGPNKCANDPQYPETHPTEVFATTDDPDYQTLYQWVSQGAVYQLNPEPPPPELPQNVDFFDNVQSRFAQRGCIGCHNAVTLEGNMDLTGPPYDVYQRLTNPNYTRVVPNDYEASYLYTKPNAAYPNVVHSGGKPIPNAEDDFARYVAGWIYEGAEFVDPGPVNFANTVVPLFGPNGLGCTTCHNQANQAAYGNLALDGTPEQIYEELTVEEQRVVPGDAMTSPLLMKSFDVFPDVAHSGGKKAIQTYYKQYHRIATWIFEGAEF